MSNKVTVKEGLFTARKRSLRRLIFSQVFVFPQGEGGSVQEGLCPGGVSVGGGGHLCVGEDLCPGGSLSGRPPSGYLRAVCILLECILAWHCKQIPSNIPLITATMNMWFKVHLI